MKKLITIVFVLFCASIGIAFAQDFVVSSISIRESKPNGVVIAWTTSDLATSTASCSNGETYLSPDEPMTDFILVLNKVGKGGISCSITVYNGNGQVAHATAAISSNHKQK